MKLWARARPIPFLIAIGLFCGVTSLAFPFPAFALPSISAGQIELIPVGAVLAILPAMIWAWSASRSRILREWQSHRGATVALLDLGSAALPLGIVLPFALVSETAAGTLLVALPAMAITIFLFAVRPAWAPAAAPTYVAFVMLFGHSDASERPLPWAWSVTLQPDLVEWGASVFAFVLAVAIAANSARTRNS